MAGEPISVQDAFFAYARGKIGLPPKTLSDYLQKASDYCHLKQPLLGMTDVIAVRKIQQKIAEGKILRFRYGKDAQTIQNVTQLYYNFVKSYREIKEQPVVLEGTPSANPIEGADSIIYGSDSIETVLATESSLSGSASEFMKNTPSLEEKKILQSLDTKNDDARLSSQFDASVEEWIITRLKKLKIIYQDKRNMSGCLWIAGGHELNSFMEECKSHGYEMHYKIDGYKAFPGKAAWWTTSCTVPVKKADQHPMTINSVNLDSFKQFLQNEHHLAERTAKTYCSAIRTIDDMLKHNNPGQTLLSSDPNEVQNTINRLIDNQSFERINEERHHQLSAAMAKYLLFVKDEASKHKTTTMQKERTIIEAVFEALKTIDLPLTFQQINDTILKNELYQFNDVRVKRSF